MVRINIFINFKFNVMMKRILLICLLCVLGWNKLNAQSVDYSVVMVPEETGTDFMKITSENDYVCMPIVNRTKNGLSWYSNRILDTSKDGKYIAYLSQRNNTTNIFIKELGKQAGSIQRTNRSAVLDFSYSPDGGYICFTEQRGNTSQVFQTNAEQGYVCRQITNANKDFTPMYSPDMKTIFFTRQEANNSSVWGYSIENSFTSNYAPGFNPCVIPNESAYLCARVNNSGNSEIWKVNYVTGIEECLVSDPERSYTTPVLSPDGQWIVFVGGTALSAGKYNYYNTDLYVCRADGSNFSQLTYHAADDLSPVWSLDGKYIYFISQRGDANGTANVWRINFNY